MKSLFQTVQARSETDPDYINTIYRQLEEVAVSDMTGKNISKIVNRVAKGENQGIQVLTGKSQTGQALGDGMDHMEFYPEKDSIREVMTALYSLVERSRQKGNTDETADR